jgi:uncharacterized protein YgbK (DUF1537 family)
VTNDTPAPRWLGIIADDYTGATDVAGKLVREGVSTLQYFGVPHQPAPPRQHECLVVALKSRSLEPAEAVALSLDAARWLLAQGVRTLFFKYCSTFDSTARGNIGPVADALADLTGSPRVIVAPSVPEQGRTVYQGHLFVGGQLLNESWMRWHPLNPMTDCSVVRLLAAQSANGVGLAPWQVVNRGPSAVAAALDGASAQGRRLVVADAVTDADLETLGSAVVDDRLVTGAAGLAVGLARARSPRSAEGRVRLEMPAGPAVVLAGSCSQATRRQVSNYSAAHPAFRLAAAGESASQEAARAADFALAHRDQAPLVYSTAEPDELAKVQNELGAARAAATVEKAFAVIAKRLVEQGFRRIVVAGGETSGAVVDGIGVRAVEIGPELDPGVPWTVTVEDRPIALLLKSGNFGGPDIFERALR